MKGKKYKWRMERRRKNDEKRAKKLHIEQSREKNERKKTKVKEDEEKEERKERKPMAN